MMNRPSEAPENKPLYWFELCSQVDMAGWVLTDGIFAQALRLLRAASEDAQLLPATLTSEYGRDEFLLVLDELGAPVPLSQTTFDLYQSNLAKHAELAHWFQAESLPDGRPVLLAARWLCHLVGFRHATVEIFIDAPGLPGFTLVQVRGMHKFEAPGAYDIPCAGHVDGLDGAEPSLRKELGEELNLRVEDLQKLRFLGNYNSYTREHGGWIINNEFRYLYQAELKGEAAGRIRFADGEVAGLAVFRVEELRRLVERFPERVASGLSAAMEFYR